MKYIVYTDGGYSQKHDWGGFAFVILDKDNSILKSGGGKMEHGTNNRCEIQAIISAVNALPDGFDSVTPAGYKLVIKN